MGFSLGAGTACQGTPVRLLAALGGGGGGDLASLLPASIGLVRLPRDPCVSQRAMAAARATPSLLDLPNELFPLIGAHLELEDKMALFSTCPHLWHLGNSAITWSAGPLGPPPDMPPTQLASWRRWMRRKRGVLRRLCLIVEGEEEEGGPPADVPAAKALLRQLVEPLAAACAPSLWGCAPTARRPTTLVWAAGWPSPSSSLELDHPASNTAGAASLSALTRLQVLSVGGDMGEPGGLGEPRQPPFLPASLTSLQLAYVTFLPSLASVTRLRRLAVDNISRDTYPFSLDIAGLEAATGLTALVLKHCCGLRFVGDGSSSDSDGSNSEDDWGERTSVVPLAALPNLEGLGLRGSFEEDLSADTPLPLSSTRLKVLDLSANSGVGSLPLAPEPCASLTRLCCSLPAASASAGDCLQHCTALEELDLLWVRSSMQELAGEDDRDAPMAQAMQEALAELMECKASLASLPRLRLVGVEDKLAAVLDSYSGPGFGPASGAAAAAARCRAELAAARPGQEISDMHTHLGPGRRLPDFDQPRWDAPEYLA